MRNIEHPPSCAHRLVAVLCCYLHVERNGVNDIVRVPENVSSLTSDLARGLCTRTARIYKSPSRAMTVRLLLRPGGAMLVALRDWFSGSMVDVACNTLPTYIIHIYALGAREWAIGSRWPATNPANCMRKLASCNCRASRHSGNPGLGVRKLPGLLSYAVDDRRNLGVPESYCGRGPV